MERKNFDKREGLSLNKLKAFNLARDIQLPIKKDEDEAQKKSFKKINSSRNIASKKLLIRTKTSSSTKRQANPYLED